MKDDPSVPHRKPFVPNTGAVCPYKSKLIDEILERENRGEPIISPPRPAPLAPSVDDTAYKYRRKPVRGAHQARLDAEAEGVC